MMISLLAYGVSALFLAAVLRPQWREMRALPGWIVIVVPALGAGVCCVDSSVPAVTRALHAIVLATMSVAAITDLAKGLIYDRALLAACVALFALLAVEGGAGNALAGAAISAAPFCVLYVVTRRRGIGLGDVKLAAVAGLGLGASATFVWAGSSFVFGALWATGGMLLGRLHRGQSVPFAPFMAAGAAFTLILPESQTWLSG